MCCNNSNKSEQVISDTSIIINNTIKDNFRTPLPPFTGGGRERLYMECLRGLNMGDRERLHRGDLRRLQMCGRAEFYKEGREEFYIGNRERLHKWSLEENPFSYNNNKKENVIASEAKQSQVAIHFTRSPRFYFVKSRDDENVERDSFARNDVYAFSLIELSIVLIIIGLLVAGVVGGKSLIESAKQRVFINELNGWKQAVYTFYAAQGRLPGDIQNKGTMGFNAYVADDYASYFPNSYKANQYSAPFLEMYLEGVSEFKPASYSSEDGSKYQSRRGTIPFSKVLKQNYLFFMSSTSSGIIDYSSNFNNLKKFKPYLMSFMREPRDIKFLAKFYNDLDKKIDDGLPTTGKFMTNCGDKYSSSCNSPFIYDMIEL